MKIKKYLRTVSGLAALALALYLAAAPLWPALVYRFSRPRSADPVLENPAEAKKEAQEFVSQLPQSEYSVSPDRVIIRKIGVNAPIVESESSEYGLDRGAWLVPRTSTPDKGGNTVITGHRFKYLPPNNLTFYLLDKLKAGDIVAVIWKGEEYYYQVSGSRIVPDTEMSILRQTDRPTLTLYTCHPIYSTEKRLVVTADLIE